MLVAARTAKFCLGAAGAVALLVEFLFEEEEEDAEATADLDETMLVALAPVDEAGMDRWAMSSRQNPPDSSRVQTAFRSGERT